MFLLDKSSDAVGCAIQMSRFVTISSLINRPVTGAMLGEHIVAGCDPKRCPT